MIESLQNGTELLPPSELRHSERLRTLQRFLLVAAFFDPLDMSQADILDTYSQIAAGLYAA